MKTKTADIYEQVTDRIISQLEQGIVPWRSPYISKVKHSLFHDATVASLPLHFCRVPIHPSFGMPHHAADIRHTTMPLLLLHLTP